MNLQTGLVLEFVKFENWRLFVIYVLLFGILLLSTQYAL